MLSGYSTTIHLGLNIQHEVSCTVVDQAKISKVNSLDWQIEVARLEEGWHIVKGKKERKAKKDPFGMVLPSHSKGGANIKT